MNVPWVAKVEDRISTFSAPDVEFGGDIGEGLEVFNLLNPHVDNALLTDCCPIHWLFEALRREREGK